MAKRVFTTGGSTMVWTPAALNASPANLSYMALKGGSSGTVQVIDILEIQVSGMNASSGVMAFMLALSSTLGATPTTLAAPGSDGLMVVGASALASGFTPVPYIAATTGPVISNAVSSPKLNLGLNAFAGILRWNAAPEQQWTTIGNAANGGESVLWNSSTHGGSAGSANAHILYEPY